MGSPEYLGEYRSELQTEGIHQESRSPTSSKGKPQEGKKVENIENRCSTSFYWPWFALTRVHEKINY